MAFDQRGLDDYIDVAQRIADFRERYPDGSLQPVDPASPFYVRKIESVGRDGKPFTSTFIVYIAACYRTPDDQRPGIGIAWETFPGRTPYTFNSELQNAETSAWGRAIIAALASDSKRGVASREEVRNRSAEREDDSGVPYNRDGSISRSRATEAQKQAAGLMSPEEEQAHRELRRGADGRLSKEDAAKRRKCSPGNPCHEPDCTFCNPDANVWTMPKPAAMRTPQPARSLPEQIAIHLDRLGIKDKDERLVITAQLAGTGRLESSKELTVTEAKQVLGTLTKCRDEATLRRELAKTGAGSEQPGAR